MNAGRIVVASITVAALAVAPATANAKIVPRVSPSKPIVDDALTISWKTDRKLKPGYQYAVLLGGGTSDGFCTSVASKTSRRNPAKGKPMSIRISYSDDILGGGGDEWCRGRATASIFMERIGDETGSSTIPLGSVSFRFYGKP